MAGRPVEDARLGRLRGLVRGLGSAVVSFSGGVDSALLALVARRELGDRAVAFTALSPAFPAEEVERARRVAAEIGIRLLERASHEVEAEVYACNDAARCYHCKREMIRMAREIREEFGFDAIVDGTVADDFADDRPGLRAAEEAGVRHPLAEADLGKRDVREMARTLGLSVWDAPPFACLATRFPTGTRITEDKLRRVAHAESVLRRLGFRQLRVRWHEAADGVLARIEVEPQAIARFAVDGIRDEVLKTCREAGFSWVTLDLQGYRDPTARRTPPGGSSGRSSSSGP